MSWILLLSLRSAVTHHRELWTRCDGTMTICDGRVEFDASFTDARLSAQRFVSGWSHVSKFDRVHRLCRWVRVDCDALETQVLQYSCASTSWSL